MSRFEVRAETITAASMPVGNRTRSCSLQRQASPDALANEMGSTSSSVAGPVPLLWNVVLPNSSIRSYVIQSHKKAR